MDQKTAKPRSWRQIAAGYADGVLGRRSNAGVRVVGRTRCPIVDQVDMDRLLDGRRAAWHTTSTQHSINISASRKAFGLGADEIATFAGAIEPRVPHRVPRPHPPHRRLPLIQSELASAGGALPRLLTQVGCRAACDFGDALTG